MTLNSDPPYVTGIPFLSLHYILNDVFWETGTVLELNYSISELGTSVEHGPGTTEIFSEQSNF